MDLWIRAQLPYVHLVKVDNIYYNYESDTQTHNIETSLAGGHFILGKYKTSQKAVSILDEIQNLLNDILIITKNYDFSQEVIDDIEKNLKANILMAKDTTNKQDFEVINNTTIVYQMPEDEKEKGE